MPLTALFLLEVVELFSEPRSGILMNNIYSIYKGGVKRLFVDDSEETQEFSMQKRQRHTISGGEQDLLFVVARMLYSCL